MSTWSTRRQLAVVFGILLGLCGLLAGFLALASWLISTHIHQIVRIDLKRIEVAQEMEISILGTGLAFAQYLHDHNAQHFDRIHKDRADFERALQQYRHLTRPGTTEASWVDYMSLTFSAFLQQGHMLIEIDHNIQSLVRIVVQQVEHFNIQLDTLLQYAFASMDTGAFARIRPLAQMRARLNELTPHIAQYLLRYDSEAVHVLADAQELRAALHQYQALALSPEENAFSQEFAVFLDAMIGRFDALRSESDHLAEGLRKFAQLRTALDDVLNEKIQYTAAHNITQTSSAVRTRLLTFAVVAAVLTLGACLLLVPTRQVARRVAQTEADVRQSYIQVQEANQQLERELHERIQTEAQLQQLTNRLEVANEELERTVERLNEVNRDLLRRNADLDEFTYVASHDLQEPLRKIMSFSSLLERDLGSNLPEPAAKDLGFITSAALRMQVLVQDLLILSRAGRSAMHFEPVRLDDCVDDALDLLAAAIERSRAEIRRDVLPVVQGDRTSLTQLYQNLIGNAIKYCQADHPIIRLTAERSGDRWLVGVHDNGIGIEEQYTPQIFLPFKRLHAQNEYEGTGIGLAICRKVVERHGGEIWVRSKVGEGSQFFVTLNALHTDPERLPTDAHKLS
jgi:signal transduction histidine kinase